MDEKKKSKEVYVLEACQVDHVFGIYENLDQAQDAACKMAYPDEDAKVMKDHMPIHSGADSENREAYYIWDDSISKYSYDPPIFRILKMAMGKNYNYPSYDARGNKIAHKVLVDDFGQFATSLKGPAYYWAYESHSEGVVFNSFVENNVDADTLSQIAEDLERITEKVNAKNEKTLSYVGDAIPCCASQAYWQYWTYNPELSEDEVVNILSDCL